MQAPQSLAPVLVSNGIYHDVRTRLTHSDSVVLTDVNTAARKESLVVVIAVRVLLDETLPCLLGLVLASL